jgi:putative transposase
VNLKVPKLRRQTFETAIIERYRRREASVEEALIEMYLAGVSVRRVEDITEALWGTKVSPSTISELNKKVYTHIEAWRNRPIEGEYPYVYLDGIVLKRSWAGEVRNVCHGSRNNPQSGSSKFPHPLIKQEGRTCRELR